MKKFEKPTFELIELDLVDIISTSETTTEAPTVETEEYELPIQKP